MVDPALRASGRHEYSLDLGVTSASGESRRFESDLEFVSANTGECRHTSLDAYIGGP